MNKKVIEKDIVAILRIEGDTADEGKIDIYDAADTILGLARTVNIVTHALSNDEKIKTKASTAKGAKTFIHSSKKGCFEEQIDILFNAKTTKKIGHSVLPKVFWDYFNLCCYSAIGEEYTPSTPHVIKAIQNEPDFIYEIADALESPLQKLHKTISRSKDVQIFINRPHVGDQITFTKESLDYVTTREEKNDTEYILGNATKFNVITGFGRIYSDEDKKTVSFSLNDLEDTRVKNLILWSMKNRVNNESDKLHFKVTKIVSSNNIVKKYIIYDALKVSL